jgi:hypothetical protein
MRHGTSKFQAKQPPHQETLDLTNFERHQAKLRKVRILSVNLRARP